MLTVGWFVRTLLQDDMAMGILNHLLEHPGEMKSKVCSSWYGITGCSPTRAECTVDRLVEFGYVTVVVNNRRQEHYLTEKGERLIKGYNRLLLETAHEQLKTQLAANGYVPERYE